MPAESDHAQKHRENRALLAGPPPLAAVSPAWAATVAFYAAVHLVERLAARDGVHHTRHSGQASRAGYLARHPTHHVLAAHLATLLSASIVARYEGPGAYAAAFPGDTTQRLLIDTHLAAIEAHVAAAIGPVPS